LINSASDFILRKTDIIPLTTIEGERAYGSNDALLILRYKPIISVESILTDNTTEEITDYELTNEDKQYGRIYRESGWSTKWMTVGVNSDPYRNLRKYTINYTAGYVFPSDVARTLPWDIEQIVLDLVALKFDKQQSKTFGIKQLKQGKRSVTYSDWDLTQEHRKVLDGYKKLVM